MKIEKIPEGYLLARKGGNGCELWRKFNGAESMACDAIDELIAERDELRAKVAEMEKQRPAAWCATDETGTVVEALGMNQSRRFDTALYLAPGAQPAPSIPEGIQRVARDVYWDSTALHYVPFVRVEFQPVASNSSDDAKGWQDRDRFFAAMLTAASEYKP